MLNNIPPYYCSDSVNFNTVTDEDNHSPAIQVNSTSQIKKTNKKSPSDIIHPPAASLINIKRPGDEHSLEVEVDQLKLKKIKC